MASPRESRRSPVWSSFTSENGWTMLPLFDLVSAWKQILLDHTPWRRSEWKKLIFKKLSENKSGEGNHVLLMVMVWFKPQCHLIMLWARTSLMRFTHFEVAHFFLFLLKFTSLVWEPSERSLPVLGILPPPLPVFKERWGSALTERPHCALVPYRGFPVRASLPEHQAHNHAGLHGWQGNLYLLQQLNAFPNQTAHPEANLCVRLVAV